MSTSRQEEIIAGVWLIAALLAYLAGFDYLANGLFVKAALDTVCALWYAHKEIQAERRTRESDCG